MSTLAMQQAAFRQVAHRSRLGLAEVNLICATCHIVHRTYDSEVNGFNEWAYKRAHNTFEVSDPKYKYYKYEVSGYCPDCK